jgi:hypothetical protein
MGTFIRYLISTINSFLAGFLSSILFTLDGATGFSDIVWPAALVGAAFAGVRLALKTLVELTQFGLDKLIKKDIPTA